MIKLNNKNITYVALADSNNSVKGVKEIWYADSNNSVKLVYRRKDALIEGDDYEKYHWLQGRNGAFINTMHPLSVFEDAFEIRARIADNTAPNPDGGENDLFGVMNDDYDRCICFYARNTGRLFFAYSNIGPGGNQIYYENKNVFSAKMVADNSNFTVVCDGESKSVAVGTFPRGDIGRNIALFQLTTIKSPNYFHGDISYFRITDPTLTTDKLHLIPCKLLKPVPKWLDANGIRRQAGECGMIDLISGKFYGNVNSVGTFTVENYYERKEWLQGRNGAYINTRYVPIPSEDSFKFKINNNGFWKNPNNDDPHVFGTYSPRIRFGTFASLPENRYFFQYSNIVEVSAPYFTSPDYIQEVTLLNDGTKTKCIANGIENEYEATITEQFNDSIWLYAINNNPSKYFHGDIAYFKITDTSSNTKMNLIPCTLTMDLPASMDANNIARTKGTSGMWDLVSDRFYGNVANSGTFKAVNLAEGVDYEVHQWLVGDGSSTIKVIGNIYRDTFSVVTVPTVTTNKILLNSMSASYDGNKSEYQIMIGSANEFSIRHGIRINNNPTAILKEFTDNYINNEYEITTYRDGDYYYGNINGVEYKNDRNFGDYQFADEDIVINIRSNGFKLGNFNSGRINLIPVKLLRSIPSKYDANGIARQAGECGMYDTVNDVFYGNVASSGSFNVEDDS